MFVLRIVYQRIIPIKKEAYRASKKRLTILARKVKHYGQKG